MKEVSLIIPMHNSEDTLEECLSSVDYSIANCIVVDDCSTDNSVSIARKFNVDVVELKTNSGQGVGKNIGIDYAFDKYSSPYIMFLDSDDFHFKNTISKMVEEISDCDIVVCNTKTFGCEREYGKLKLSGTFLLNSETSQKTPCVAWNKIYKAENLKNVRFSDTIPEDNPFWFIYCCQNYNSKIKYIDDVLYNYRIREDGSYMQQQKGVNKFYDSINSSFYIYDWLIKNNKEEFIDWYIESYFYNMIKHFKNTTKLDGVIVDNYVKSMCKLRNIEYKKEL